MRVIRSYRLVPPEVRGAVAAIGNFDGVHRGHQSVIDVAKAMADEIGSPLGVITFEPHPRQFFAPNSPPFRLMSSGSKEDRLKAIGVDVMFELPFDASLSSLKPEEFSRDVLAEGLGVSHVVVGTNFRYGKGRAGNACSLASEGERLGFGVATMSISGDDAGDFSSSAVRAAVSEGRPEDAARMLGHRHHLRGTVERGDRRGRELGFPTANITLAGLLPPRFGVYAVLVDILTGPHSGCYRGCASIGVRPTFGENPPNLEVFIFDFDHDIYGETVSVSLVAYQRPEMKFESPEGLIRQMRKDCEESGIVLARDA